MSTSPTLPRRALLSAGAAATGALLATPALSQNQRRWRMATAWPKNLPGPGVSAQRIADRIGALSDERLTVELFAAGELVPAFGVFDAVATGAVEIGHAASVFWTSKMRAAALFTAAPFGLTPWEHLAWIEAGDGQAAWQTLYAPFGVRPYLGGNTGPSLGGWFRRPLAGLDDLKGLKMRIAGLGAETLQALGVSPQSLAPGEIVTALQTGVVDGAEFASPSADYALGLSKAAAIGYAPGFHEPNGASEALINDGAWSALPADLQAIVAAACREEHAMGLAESERTNAAALERIAGDDGAQVARWPSDVIAAAGPAALAALAALAEEGPAAAAALTSWRAARDRAVQTASASYAPFLAARAAALSE